MATPAPDAGHPGSDYYVNDVSGTIQAQSNPAFAAGLLASGWSGPFDWAGAQAQVASNPSTAAKGAVAAVNPLSGLEGISRVLGDVGTALTDGKLWRSLGWLVLGVLLLFTGVFLWMKSQGIAPPVPIPIPV